jgi:16S rRNA (cytidine1402-2'-O)-methyltransferase
MILAALREHDVVFVTDAGMPALSDPGSQLVAAAAEEDVPVKVVPGPSALTAALAVAGLPVSHFVFLGFPPSRRGPRLRLLRSVAALPYALVLFEAPHRLRETLGDLEAVLGERRIAVCRELTKRFEEVFRGTAHEALKYFQEPRGEFTLVIAAAEKAERVGESAEDVEELARAELSRLKAEGQPPGKAVAQVVRRWRLPRQVVYGWWVEEG